MYNLWDKMELIFGIVDVLFLMLIVLPLYPNPVDGYIFSVNLFDYTETTSFIRLIYRIMFITLIVIVKKIMLLHYLLDITV